MKNLSSLVIVLLIAQNVFCANTDTINITSGITDVTVFFSGAQLTRTAKLNLSKGQHLLRFDQLPFEINSQSIQVDGIEHCEILSVKHLISYNNSSIKDKNEKEIQKKIDLQELKIKAINNQLNVFDLESKLLLDNSNLQKKDDGSAISDIKEAADYYRSRLNDILQNKLELTTELKDISDSIQSLYTQLNEVNSKKKMVYSQILILVECSEPINAPMKVSYYIASAGWVPLYDFRVYEITDPLTIVYNSNVYQSTGEDWNNVNIRLSTNNPSLSGNKPELLTWNLGQPDPYAASVANAGVSGMRGRVTDAANYEPIPFANVMIKTGNEMVAGAITDINGQYTIKPVPAGYYAVEVTYIGYNNSQAGYVSLEADKVIVQDFSISAIVLQVQNEIILEEYEISGADANGADGNADIYFTSGTPEEIGFRSYKGNIFKRKKNSISGWNYDFGNNPKDAEVTSNYISNSLKSTLSNLEYVIEVPYTVPSDGEDYLIKIQDTNISVSYAYHAVPKLDHDVFLVAEIYDWTHLNLLSGKTSIYYQGTFTGESYIDANNSSDTMSISLGRDKNILVQRQGIKETFDKRIIGSNIKETVGYDIIVKNNKQSEIRIIIEDQYPISEKKSVEVELLEFPEAVTDIKTGKLSWELKIKPGEKKVLMYKYSVKYPKYLTLDID